MRWVRDGRSGNEYDARKCKKCSNMPCCLLIFERHVPAFHFPEEWKQRAREKVEIGWDDGAAAGGGAAGTSDAHGEADASGAQGEAGGGE